ncbi:hypothetical protein OIDMADRAFT_186000 [Oidiodendron maius Zn]|uniref:Thiamine-binding protein domain-containing protein n=1 Tax=Oidiodendron maius (strain Zn) TaxID=913774 RepID=A0A0C3HGT5_OIDMZ|nr:hypothetical protein OIDMADRAFT_186000 [Oidiodendron maius Zn]
MEYSKLPTPPACVADFCLIPIGTTSPSVSNEVAAVQRLMKESGLTYTMHSAGTTLEGTWDEVMHIIGQAHTLVHQNGVLRVQTDIRAGTRTDKKQHFSEKVSKVESILAADGKSVEKKVFVTETIQKTEGEAVAAAPQAQPEPLNPATHKGTWASMLRK